MKCPACKKSHKRSAGGRCTCGYNFVFFSPKGAPKPEMTDARFEALLKRVSRDGTRYFTKQQLNTAYTELERKLRPGLGSSLVVLVVAGVAVVMFMSGNIWAGLVVAIVALLGAFGIWGRRNRPPPDPAVITRSLQRWKAARRQLPMLLEQPSLTQPPPEWKEPDIYDYGVERILFVQHPLLVDLFVKNGLFAEQKALILSETGYPKYLVPHAERILSKARQFPVFLLHDADAQGMQMHNRLAAQKRFNLHEQQVIDLGLSPTGVSKLKKLQSLQTWRHQNQLSASAMPYGLLQAGVTLGMLEMASMTELLAQRETREATEARSMDFG